MERLRDIEGFDTGRGMADTYQKARQLDDLITALQETHARMTKGAAQLQTMAGEQSLRNPDRSTRYAEKASGVRVARGYLEDTLRSLGINVDWSGSYS